MTPAAAWATARNVARACAMWDSGLTAAEIARRMGCTKSALIGYAHRHGWAPRPSPILGPPKRPGAHPKVARKRPPAPPMAPPEPLPALRACQWIEGPGRPWTMCGQPTVRNGPWCAVHRAIVFHRYPPPRLEHAAA